MDYGLKFSDPKIIMTKNGERRVSSAAPTEEFWSAWRANKDVVKAAGFSLSKFNEQWQVSRWEQAIAVEERTAAREQSRAVASDIDIPCRPELEYLPYQRAGIAYALGREKTLIADEMGLGKTIQAIGVLNATDDAHRVLVICPKVVLLNWKRELAKWQTKPRTIFAVQAGDAFPVCNDPHVVIINYNILDRYEQDLRVNLWDVLIVDEAHYLKNDRAQRTHQVFGRSEVAKRIKGQLVIKSALAPIPSKRCLLLTGTPILNRPQELWTLIHYCDPKRWNRYWSFATRYCGAFRGQWGMTFGAPRNLDELQARLRDTIMVRRLKSEVLTELPAKRRQVLPIPVNGAAKLIAEELEAYNRVEAAKAALELAASGHGNYEEAVAALKEAERYAFSELARVRAELAVAKIEPVLEHLKGIEDHKVVVMCHHKTLIKALVEGLREEGVVKLTGDDSAEDREAAVAAFQNDPNIRFFIGSMHAAGVGITLTASSHVIFGELDWTPGIINQAEDRCHRIGQKDNVFIQHLVFDGSLDSKMAKLIVEKQETITKALDDATDVDLNGTDYVPPVQAPSVAQVAVNAKRAALDAAAQNMSVAQRQAAHEGIKILDGLNSDMATEKNAMGFNRMDGMIGRTLALEVSLSPRQAALASKILRKYRRQLPAPIYQTLYPE